MHWLFARCLHACVCVCFVFYVCPLRPCIDLLFTSITPPLISIPSSIPTLALPPFPFSFIPLIHTLTFFLSKGSTVYIINMISTERSSPSIPEASALSLSVFPSLTSSPDLPHSLSSLLWYPQSDSFLWVYFYLSLTLYVSLPLSPVHAITALLWNVMIEHRQKQFEPKQGRSQEPDTERRIYSFFSIFPFS